MIKRVIALINVLGLVLGICACGSINDMGENNKDIVVSVDEGDEEEKIETIGIIAEIIGGTYKIKLMGYDVNEIPAYLFVDKQQGDFQLGDEVMVVLNDYAYMIDTAYNKVSFDTVSEYGKFMEDKEEVWYMADINSIYLYENDGVFRGELGGICDKYDESMEKIIKSIFVIEPNDDEPECGFFHVDTLMVPKHKTMGSSVTVTYDKETFEVLSIE